MPKLKGSPALPAEARIRTPLTHVSGAETRQGDPVAAERLAQAFRVTEADHQEAISGAHGLHPYPARIHPVIARRLVTALPADTSILDPFCGSGTVLVEARRARRYARGSDSNPIAVRLARLRCIPAPNLELVRQEADRCADRCMERRDTPFAVFSKTERSYPKHVFAGLISLRDEIEKTINLKVRELLLFCFSPLLDKFAARADREAPRVPRFAVRDNFLDRVARWLAFFEESKGWPFAEVEEADARWLPWKPLTSTAVITSPPYPGVYDYAEAQARRARWIGGADALMTTARRMEIGRKSDTGTPEDWTEGMSFALKQISRTLKPDSPIFLVVADGVIRGRTVRVADLIADLARSLRILEPIACVSQERPHFHGPTQGAFANFPRQEHLIELRRIRAPDEA